MTFEPLYINCPSPGAAPQYTAAELRQAMALGGIWGGRDLGARQGVRPGGTQWQVTLAGSTITILPGVGLVDPGLTSAQGPYWTAVPAQETQTLQAAHATSPRKDIVIIRVYDADEDASGNRFGRSEYIAGTAAPSPSEPAVPAGSVKIATIDVPPSGGGSPVVTLTAPYTVAPGGVLPVRNATELAAVVPYAGMAVYLLDGTGLLVWSGTAWVNPVNLLGLQTAAMAGKKLLAQIVTANATGGQTHTTTTISFGTTFATPPVVQLTLATHPPNPIHWHLEGAPTTTQCVIAVGKIDGTAFGSGASYSFHLTAIG